MNDRTQPERLGDLKTPSYNPRQISPKAAAALRRSLYVFGDLAGVVYNRATGHLLCANQRKDQLEQLDLGALEWGAPYTVTLGQDGRRFESTERDAWASLPGGARFRIREVNWTDALFEKAANVAANSPAIAGEFTDQLGALLEEIADTMPDLTDDLLLQEIPLPALEGAQEAEDPEQESPLPQMELQPFEHYDYLVVLARSTQDWEWLCERLKIQRVNASPLPGKKKIGVGRAIDARRLIAALQGEEAAHGQS